MTLHAKQHFEDAAGLPHIETGFYFYSDDKNGYTKVRVMEPGFEWWHFRENYWEFTTSLSKDDVLEHYGDFIHLKFKNPKRDLFTHPDSIKRIEIHPATAIVIALNYEGDVQEYWQLKELPILPKDKYTHLVLTHLGDFNNQFVDRVDFDQSAYDFQGDIIFNNDYFQQLYKNKKWRSQMRFSLPVEDGTLHRLIGLDKK